MALFIDWENLSCASRGLNRAGAEAQAVVKAAGCYGRVGLARAYADWMTGGSWSDAPQLQRVGIEPVYVPGWIKNSADTRLVVDALEHAWRTPEVKTFVLGGGDGDLVQLALALRRQARWVVALSAAPTLSAALATVAEDVLRYDDGLEPTRPAVGHNEHVELNEVLAWIGAVLVEKGGHCRFNRLGFAFKSRYGFSAKQDYGRSLRAVLEQAEAAGTLRIEIDSAGQYCATLSDAGGLTRAA